MKSLFCLTLILFIFNLLFFFTESRGNVSSKRDDIFTTTVIISGSLLIIFNISSGIIFLLKRFQSNLTCKYNFYSESLSNYFFAICIYSLFWYKIYAVFFRKRIIQQSVGKYFFFAHMLVLPFLVFIFTVNVPLALIQIIPYYNNSHSQCNLLASPVYIDALFKVSAYLSAFLPAVIDSIFIISFVLPLYLHQKQMLSRELREGNLFQQVILRAAIAGTVCFSTDFLVVFIPVFVRFPTYILHFISSCNLVVDLLAIIMFFPNWRERLFPFNRN